jgi:glycosyltransferase involved in cell wall biosynthesis
MRFGTIDAVVSVVIPCLDEEDPIAGVVREVLAQGVDEVIVVDNGSRDATATRAREAGARVILELRRGYGFACATGVEAVAADTEMATAATFRPSSLLSFRPSHSARRISSWGRASADFANPAV